MDEVLKGQILEVRDTGLVNMFDVRGVREVALVVSKVSPQADQHEPAQVR